MAFSWVRFGVFAAAMTLTGTVPMAQQSSVERKVKSRMTPQCSELEKRMSVSGKVRIEVTIAPDGHVKNTRALGGHPLLVQSSLDVMRDWKYEAGPEETTQVVEFDFKCQ